MAENSGIAWTTHTFNPWIGCTKVSPGCDHCYAETWNARFGGGVAPNWGPGAPRRRTDLKNWNRPLRWQRLRRQAIDAGENPPPVRVFTASLADVFDNEVPDEWRRDLFELMLKCPDLDWQVVTKRIGNVSDMLRRCAPDGILPTNAILIATIVNQEEADRDMPKFRTVAMSGAARFCGVSFEPALGHVDWTPWLDFLDWIIIGGESDQGKAKARPFYLSWARSTIDQCHDHGMVSVFMKQVGSCAVGDQGVLLWTNDKAGAEPIEWPADIRVREFPVMR